MSAKEFEILLVDDSPEDTELALYELKKCNLSNKITCFSNGADAFNYILNDAHADTPLLIFLDLNMPQMSGLEFLQKVKESPRTKNISIAILSSSIDLPDIKKSMRMGITYIPKPISIDDIVKFAKEMDYEIKLMKRE